jgi:regulator of protease activity HflC (stomatin/prohibitin superfamily)
MYQKQEEEKSGTRSWIKRGIITVVVIALLIIFNPLSCVGPNERGVKILFGAVKEAILKPGMQVHIPFVETIRKYSIVPSVVTLEIPVGASGAITKDNQTVGVEVTIFWRYMEERINEIAKNYTEDRLKGIIRTTGEAAVKSAIGQYTIFDLAINQNQIAEKIRISMVDSLVSYPITLTELKLTNYDWSEEFDRNIQDTMNQTQKVKMKEQELETARLESQKMVASAEAKKNAEIAIAEGEKEQARLRSEAKIIEGNALKEYNKALAENLSIEIRIRELEIEKLKIEKWDGKYVPNNMYGPIPFDTRGGVQGR